MATEFERFKERISSLIGILMHHSLFSTSSSSGKPAVSLPKTIKQSSGYFTSVYNFCAFVVE